MILNRKQRNQLREAVEIIRSALVANTPVRIPGFGKFYIGTVTCRESLPDAGEDGQQFVQTVPRFRAYAALKTAVRRRKFIT